MKQKVIIGRGVLVMGIIKKYLEFFGHYALLLFSSLCPYGVLTILDTYI